MATKLKRVVWLVPEVRGGIRDYSDSLWPSIEERSKANAIEVVLADCPPICTRKEADAIVERVRQLGPDLIHVQHEFGLFGSKIFPFYQFPRLAKDLSKIAPCIATAHNVLFSNYSLPWRGKGFKGMFRLAFNFTALPLARGAWLGGTWGKMAGVIVHSKLQAEAIRDSSDAAVAVIPHYVPHLAKPGIDGASAVVVFGFFSADKGQDLVIQAWAKLKTPPLLILAGGVRRVEDQDYFDYCNTLIKDLGLEKSVQISGYVPADKINDIYAGAKLVIAPFRESSGSGSLPQALGRGAAVLASDLAINLELNERVPGCIATFQSESAADCAAQVQALLGDDHRRAALSKNALEYSAKFQPSRIADLHFHFYEKIFSR